MARHEWHTLGDGRVDDCVFEMEYEGVGHNGPRCVRCRYSFCVHCNRVGWDTDCPGTCCDMHNEHCEPPADLCCFHCTERNHPEHPPQVECTRNRGATIRSRLTEGRRAAGLTQQDVARQMGTTQSAVSELETGAGEPDAFDAA